MGRGEYCHSHAKLSWKIHIYQIILTIESMIIIVITSLDLWSGNSSFVWRPHGFSSFSPFSKVAFLKSCHFLILKERIITITIKLLQRWSHPYHLCCCPSKLSLSNNSQWPSYYSPHTDLAHQASNPWARLPTSSPSLPTLFSQPYLPMLPPEMWV